MRMPSFSDAIDDHTDGVSRPHPHDDGLYRHAGADERHADRVDGHRRALAVVRRQHIAIGAVATAIPLAWQLNNIAGWVARSVTSIFENIGMVQDGMRSIDVPRQMPDPPDAVPNCTSPAASIRIETLHFDYGRVSVRRPPASATLAVLHGIDLIIAPGERVGLIGPSGAGKSTLVNLLLHFYNPAAGRILIDGQDIAWRDAGKPAPAHRHGHPGHFAAAPVDPGEHPLRPTAVPPTREIVTAAKQAHAHEFILGLEDWHGRSAAMTRMSANVASSCPAASASASP